MATLSRLGACVSLFVDTCFVSWQRSHAAVQALNRLIPNFQKTIDDGTPEELNMFYVEVSNIALYIGLFLTYFPIASAWR